MKACYFTISAALILGTVGCDLGTPAEPAPTTLERELTDLQHHIKDDAIKALSEGAYSKQGVIDYLAKEYPTEDVKAGVADMACEADWKLEAVQKAESYGETEPAKIKDRLLADGFTEEEAEFGANPVQQNT
jgi:SOS response regulatory protein OraA/RecX